MNQAQQKDNTQAGPSLAKSIVGLLRDHLELASLEWTYEKEAGRRRLTRFGAGAVLLLLALIFSQIALAGFLVRSGMRIEWVGVLGFAVYGLGAWLVLNHWAKRDEKVGKPFEATSRQLQKDLNWIEKRFS